MRAPRIGLVIGQLSIGGAEGQLLQVVRGLRGRCEPIVFSLSAGGGPLREELAGLGARVRTIGDGGLKRAVKLKQALAESGVELVHAWLFIANAYVLAARMLGMRVPIITSARNCKVQGRVSQLANTLAFRASAAVIVNSTEVDAYIRRHYRAPSDRIRLLHNGVDIERFHPATATPIDYGSGTIVTIGRLVPQKNHELFVRAAAALAKTMPQLRFVIVGDGPLRGELEKLGRDLGIGERLTFAGERRDVDVILRSASLFWLTSRWEGMPNVVLESLASGVPAIATDVGGTRELIRDGQDGFIVRDGDGGAFVEHSRALLSDAERMTAFRRSARSRAQEFGVGKMVDKLCAVYDEVLSRR